jgi:hypothetical protein
LFLLILINGNQQFPRLRHFHLPIGSKSAIDHLYEYYAVLCGLSSETQAGFPEVAQDPVVISLDEDTPTSAALYSESQVETGAIVHREKLFQFRHMRS